MKIKPLSILGAIGCSAVVSCYPPIPPKPLPPKPPVREELKPNPNEAGLSLEERRQLEILRAKAEGREPDLEQFGGAIDPLKPSDKKTPETNNGLGSVVDPPKIDKPKPDVKKSWPYATAVPGKEGFVFNPYNNAQVDVRGLPSGTLVKVPGRDDQQFYVP